MVQIAKKYFITPVVLIIKRTAAWFSPVYFRSESQAKKNLKMAFSLSDSEKTNKSHPSPKNLGLIHS